MKKKIVLTIMAMMVVVAGVITLSAYEAHIINVTAHIENALDVIPRHIEFGTVFPQEIFTGREFKVSLSQSFMEADRADDVEYFVQKKPKVRPSENNSEGDPFKEITVDNFTGPNWQYCLENGPIDAGDPEDPYYIYCYPDLCGLIAVSSNEATGDSGYLAKSEDNISDTWQIDFAVPCFQGMCDQGYDPQIYGEPLDPRLESQVFGCDIWVEVEGLSYKERYPETGNAYIGYEDWYNGDFDYNDFGMNFEAEEYYNSQDELTKLKMTFTAMIYDSGADHYIHIRRPLVGNYNYTVTRGASSAGEIAAGNYPGSGEFDVVLFDTAKYIWPSKLINEVVTIEIVLDDPTSNPKSALVAPRWDVDPFMANYDPYEVVYGVVSGTFHIADKQTISSTANQKNTPEIIPIGTELPFILVVPFNDWIPPYEDTTITGPYQYFTDYYASAGALYPDWFKPVNVRPGYNAVIPGGLSWGPYTP